MANIVKEVEVAGVKHSITLADNMIGSGLKRDADGGVGVTIGAGLIVSPSFGTLEVDVNSICGSGLTSDGIKLGVNVDGLAGSGLVAIGGKLVVTGGGGSVDAGSLAGSGLRSVEGNKLALALSGNSYLSFAPDASLTVNTSTLASGLIEPYGGLGATPYGLSVNVGGGLRKETSYEGKLVIDYENLFDSDSFRLIYGPIMSVGVKVTSGIEIYPENGIKVKIAERSSGLRLILNDKGELDVTQ